MSWSQRYLAQKDPTAPRLHEPSKPSKEPLEGLEGAQSLDRETKNGLLPPATMTDYERRVRAWLAEIGETDPETIEQTVANALTDPSSLSACVAPPEGAP